MRQAGKHNRARTKELRQQLATQQATLAELCRRHVEYFPVPALKDIPAVKKSTPVADGKAGVDGITMQRALGMLCMAQYGAGGPGKDKAVDQKLLTALRKYDEGRAAVVKTLVPLLLQDVTDYQQVYSQCWAASDPSVGARLRAAELAVQEDIASTTPDPRAPPTDSPLYIIYSQAVGTGASMQLYTSLEQLVAPLALRAKAVVFPGGVKGAVRICPAAVCVCRQSRRCVAMLQAARAALGLRIPLMCMCMCT